MGKKKILILLPGHQIFGQEQALISIAKILQSDEIEFKFLIHKKWGSEIGEKLKEMKFDWSELPFGTIWSLSLIRSDYLLPIKNFMSVFLVTLKAFSVTERKNFTHVIIGNATFGYYLLPFIFLMRNKIKIIYRHGDKMAEHTRFHRVLNNILMKFVDIHVANCLFLARDLIDRRPSINSKIIYNLPQKIIESRLFDDELKNKQISKEKTLLFVGQISKNKGADLLFCAFISIIKNYPGIKLMVVGEVPGVGAARSEEMMNYVAEISKKYQKNIEFLGYQSDVSKYYLKADILICPSVYEEPSANVVLEAKYLGIPAVVFNVGGMPELIENDVDGYICPEISSDALEMGIVSYLENIDKLSRSKIAAAKNFEKKFGVERYVSKWLEILNK
jgi:glycosyltransferase involved in cell wall biosynthesis